MIISFLFVHNLLFCLLPNFKGGVYTLSSFFQHKIIQLVDKILITILCPSLPVSSFTPSDTFFNLLYYFNFHLSFTFHLLLRVICFCNFSWLWFFYFRTLFVFFFKLINFKLVVLILLRNQWFIKHLEEF
jgi:hypothetical protein